MLQFQIYCPLTLAKFLLFSLSLNYANILTLNNMLKNLAFIATIACLATSCSVFKPAATKPVSTRETEGNPNGVQFISNVSIKPDTRQDNSRSSITAASANAKTSVTADNSANSKAIEAYPALKFKYAILENCSVEDLDNPKLLSFMDYWYGTPYHYGGTTRDGIDCSAFSFLLLSSVYGVGTLPRTSKEQYEASHHISRDDLQEGDLVFFHTLGRHRTVTHVGVYLRNNKFIHASVSGVMISDMNEGYYDKHFIGAGRVTDPAQTRAGNASNSSAGL
jgi:lipoprotein Spr